MGKEHQATMTKQKKRPVKKDTRRTVHRHKKEEDLQRTLTWAAVAVLAIIVAVMYYLIYLLMFLDDYGA